MVGESSESSPRGILRTTTDLHDIPERALLRPKEYDDENAYFFAKGRIYKTISVWKHVTDDNHDPKDDALWTNEDDVFLEAERYATLSEAYHVNYGDESVNSDLVGIWYFGGRQERVSRIKLSAVKHKVVVHLIDGRRYAYKIL